MAHSPAAHQRADQLDEQLQEPGRDPRKILYLKFFCFVKVIASGEREREEAQAKEEVYAATGGVFS
jgi:hypothetical protein